MKLLILNGPNLNRLGVREPDIYGRETYDELMEKLKSFAEERGHDCTFFQSNHEGDLIDRIQAAEGRFDGIVINPAAYTHYSIAIRDALLSVSVPAVEVHLSDINAREAFRRVSVTKDACIAQVAGQGIGSYFEAVKILEGTR